MSAAPLAALLLLMIAQPQPSAPLAQGGYAAPGGDASLSCEQLAAELTVAVGGAMGNGAEQVRIAQGQQAAVDREMAAGRLLGMVGAALPNAAAGLLAGIDHQRQERSAREAEAGAMREQVLAVEQEVRLDRLQRLHEMHQQRCANRQAP